MLLNFPAYQRWVNGPSKKKKPSLVYKDGFLELLTKSLFDNITQAQSFNDCAVTLDIFFVQIS